ncbi:2TM domain-containing protein [Acidovorax sp. sic0104]|uniref:2TM domain-containing protein n=1 Tax=Acidovorax sp. sic0104 TaxID=2854784 RepID=UPI001C438ED6|nr:2TM domain-containing protein [Acidovorax sp. sic0104]MBV7544472.1 2TM domain-containing protein [Acidovorax sp. sic0104]
MRNDRYDRFGHDTPLDAIERLARKRAGAKLGWYMHAGVYLLVNLLLITLSATSGRHWAVYPALGWGLGLAIHGIVVFLVAGGGLHERMVQAERNRLVQQQGHSL